MVLLRRRDWAGGAGPVVDAWNGVEPGTGALVVVDDWVPDVVVVVPNAENGVVPAAVEVGAG